VVCGKTCATPVTPGNQCSLDLCATNGTCAGGYTCVPTGSGNSGTCQAFVPPDHEGYTSSIAAQCNQTTAPTSGGVSYDECANELFCKDLDRCAPSPARALGHARCAAPQPEGYACDSDLATYNRTANCLPCAPGLSCVALAGSADDKRCVRTCTVDGDCPCERGGGVAAGSCTTVGSTKVCKACTALGGGCNSQVRCCTAGQQCGAKNDGSPDKCCLSLGGTCTTTDDCCGRLSGNAAVCATSGSTKTCQICKDIAQACTSTDQCCSGTCSSGFCRGNCVAGGACNTGLKGACKSGHFQCDQFGKQTCVEDVSPTPDTSCNGVDEDCNGTADDKYPSPSCTVTKTAAECGYPSSFQVTGVSECKNGAATCQTQAGKSYCFAPDGGACGVENGSICDAAHKCGIGLVCATQPSGPSRCQVIANPACPINNLTCYPLNSPYLGGCLP
jgi:hypothetical protein